MLKQSYFFLNKDLRIGFNDYHSYVLLTSIKILFKYRWDRYQPLNCFFMLPFIPSKKKIHGHTILL